MKKIFKKEKIKQYWQKFVKSSHERMSRGSQSIKRIISWARGENWRGKKEKKK